MYASTGYISRLLPEIVQSTIYSIYTCIYTLYGTRPRDVTSLLETQIIRKQYTNRNSIQTQNYAKIQYHFQSSQCAKSQVLISTSEISTGNTEQRNK
jgi:hypothetical protein